MALALHGSAHDAERHLRPAVGMHGKGRNDGVRGALARADLIGMTGLGGEAVAAVLQADARARHDHARAEAHVVGLDERDHHAAGIGRRQIDRAAGPRGAVGGCAGLLAVYETGALAQVVAVQQLRGGDAHMVQVGVVLVQIRKGQLHGLDLQVHAIHAVQRLRSRAQLVQHAQRHQRRNTLAVGRDLVDHRVTELLRHRSHPVGLVRGQIFLAHHAAAGPRMLDHLPGQRAAVEGLAHGLGNLFQRARMGFAPEHFTGPGSAATGQKALGKAGLVAQFLAAQLPQRGNRGRDRETVACIVDGGLGHLREGQLAEALGQRHPGRHGAGHGHGIPALFRNAAELGKVVGRPARRRAARGVEAVQLLAVPDDGKAVAADAAARGLDHRERHRRGQCRIHGVAASQQHGEAGLRGQRLRSADHITPQHRRAVRGIGKRPVLDEVGHI